MSKTNSCIEFFKGAGVILRERIRQLWKRSDIRESHRQVEEYLENISVVTMDEVFERLETTNKGLLYSEAERRLKLAGPNIVSHSVTPPIWLVFLGSIPSPFNALLAFIAILSAISPSPSLDTVIILVTMIAISVMLRFVQEYRSSIEVSKLQSTTASMIRVRRQVNVNCAFNHVRVFESLVPENELVDGDIIYLRPGDSVPADCRVIESNHLRVSQAVLSGESNTVRKEPRLERPNGTYSILGRENIVFMGTTAVSGSAVCVVVGTGPKTFTSSIAEILNKARPPNAFDSGVRKVSFMMCTFMLTMVPIVFIISMHSTGDSTKAALFSVSVAVSLVPELLPAIVYSNLARGAMVVSKKRVLVKNLHAVQNLGGMTVLCSDKTGTLTTDVLTVSKCTDAKGIPDMNVFYLAFINAASQAETSNDIDHAIIQYRTRCSPTPSIPYNEMVNVIPFSFERRRSSCIIRNAANNLILICKGAAEEIISRCVYIRSGVSQINLDSNCRQQLTAHITELERLGYRVLLLASRKLDLPSASTDPIDETLESDMVLEGIIALSQPLKEDASSAIDETQNLGVEVKILTGDSLEHALRTCHDLRLSHGFHDDVETLTGPQLDEITDIKQLDATVQRTKLFARLTPGQKARVVRSLQRQGHSVGMLGDGVNDCVALHLADVGITVNTANSAARDCSDVILTEKDLRVLVDAITTGRITHGNTVKYIKMVASSNFGNVFSVLIASALLSFEPMTSLQLLVQNLLYDISQIAIPWDTMDEEYVHMPRNWDASDLLRFVLCLGPISSTIDICTFYLGLYYYQISAENPAEVALFRTHWFLQGLLTQSLIIHNLRTVKVPIFQSSLSKPLAVSTGCIMVIGLLIPYCVPIRNALKMARPENSFLGFLIVELLVYCLEVELVKVLYMKIFRTWI